MTNEQELASELDRLFSGEINFIFGSNEPGKLPPESFPEIAVVGKSNVGKSSLINALTNRKALARVSHTPGRTQQINFFQVRDKFCLVDLPGYGYAKVSKADHKNWEKMIIGYLAKRPNLKLVLLLVDGRHGIKENDIQVMELLQSYGIYYWLVYTKSDKVPLREHEQLEHHARSHSLVKKLQVLFANSKTNEGTIKLKALFAHFIKYFAPI